MSAVLVRLAASLLAFCSPFSAGENQEFLPKNSELEATEKHFFASTPYDVVFESLVEFRARRRHRAKSWQKGRKQWWFYLQESPILEKLTTAFEKKV